MIINFFISAIVFFINSAIASDLQVSTKILDIPYAKKISYIIIKNKSFKKTKIHVSIVPIDNAEKKHHLIAVPNMFALNAGESKNIRFLKTHSSKKKELYCFIYVVGEESTANKRIKILAIIRPEVVVGKLQFKKKQNVLLIENIGNVTSKLYSIQKCNNSECITHDSIVIFPGQIREISLKNTNTHIKLTQQIINKNKSVYIR